MRLKSIWIYPLKSFNGIEVSETKLRENGSLYFDREFAFQLEGGKLLTAKRKANIHLFPIQYRNLESGFYSLKTGEYFSWKETEAISQFFSNALDETMTFGRNGRQGFPDDLTFDLKAPA